MIEWVVIGLLQAVAGEPAAPAPSAQPTAEQTGAAAEPEAEAAPATQPHEPQMREERVCRRLDAATGERFRRRVCETVLVPVEPPEPEASPH